MNVFNPYCRYSSLYVKILFEIERLKNQVWYSSVLPKIVPASFILECYDPFDNNMNNEHVWEWQ